MLSIARHILVRWIIVHARLPSTSRLLCWFPRVMFLLPPQSAYKFTELFLLLSCVLQCEQRRVPHWATGNQASKISRLCIAGRSWAVLYGQRSEAFQLGESGHRCPNAVITSVD